MLDRSCSKGRASARAAHAGHAAALAARPRKNPAASRYTWWPDGLATRNATCSRPGGPGQGRGGAVRGAAAGRPARGWLDAVPRPGRFRWPSPWPPGVSAGPEPSAGRPPSVAEIGGTWYAASASGPGSTRPAKLLMLTHAFDVWEILRVTLRPMPATPPHAGDRAAGGPVRGRPAGALPRPGRRIRTRPTTRSIASEWPEVRAGLRRRLARCTETRVSQAHVFVVFAGLLVLLVPVVWWLVPDHHGNW